MLSMTSPSMIALRRLSRRIGVNALAGRVLGARGYEAKVWDTISQSVKPGDCVWDVGANIGLYTRQFLDLVGPQGRVVAFEPSPTNRVRLEQALVGRDNATVMPIALSRTSGTAVLLQGEDEIGATSRITAQPSRPGSTHQITMAAGDDLVAKRDVASPTVLKIDVEGHEIDVLLGLGEVLKQPTVRHVFVEVHFELLEAQGLTDGPRSVEGLLRDGGLHLRWLDPSHVHAFRRP